MSTPRPLGCNAGRACLPEIGTGEATSDGLETPSHLGTPR